MENKNFAANDRLDFLGVGHAPFTAVNRRFYRALAARGISVELVIPRRLAGSHRKEAQPAEPGDPPIHWTETTGDDNRFWYFTELDRVLKERRPRVIYLENDPASIMAVKLGRWATANGAALISYINQNDLHPIFHALLRKNLKGAVRTLRYKLFAPFSRHHIHTVLAICQDGLEAMRLIGMGDKTRIMPLGYDADLFKVSPEARAATRAELGLNKTTLAYFGRVVPIKGVHVLVEALEKLRDLEWQFLIDEFADNPNDHYANEVKQRLMSQPWLAERTVTFNASHTEIPRFMNACDVVVLPSTWREQYGRVVPEAMACGAAPVVSDAGALPELVGDTGIVTRTGDAQSLADGLRRIISQTGLRTEYGRKAAIRAVNKLSIDAQVAIVLPIVQEILKKS